MATVLLLHNALRATSALFAALKIIRAPLIVTIFASIVLSVPDQFLELYRILAQDLTIKSDLVPRYRELFWAGLTFGALAFFLWHSTSLLAASSLHPLTTERVLRVVLKYGPAVLLLTLIAGLCAGILRAQTPPVGQLIVDPLEESVIDSLAEMRGLSQPSLYMREVLARVATRLSNASHDLRLVVLIVAAMGAVLLAVLAWTLGPHAYRTENRDFRLKPLRLAVTAAIVLIVFAVPSGISVTIGPLAVFFIFCTLLLFVLHGLTQLSSRVGIPLLSTLVAFAILLSAFNLNDNHPIYRLSSNAAPASDKGSLSIEQAFDEWFHSRVDRDYYKSRGKPYPVYVFAAQGGGIYAAFHAAMVLGALQDRCDAFRDHLFAISSVSGGSLGAAVFNSLTRLDKRPASKEPCRSTSPSEGAEKFYVQSADVVLSQDFLSPLVSSFFFGEAIQRIVPRPIDLLDRGRALEARFEGAFAQFLAQTEGPGTKSQNPMASAYSAHWSSEGTSPALLINTTEVGSGRRRVIAPFTFAGGDLLFLPLSGRDAIHLPLSTAAGLSARFPWLSPAAYFQEAQADIWGRKQATRLVDGGYFDNSGVSTALDLIRGVEDAARRLKIDKDINVVLVVLTHGGYGQLPFLGMGEVFSPIFTLLSVRAARGYISIQQAERELNLSSKDGVRYQNRVRKVLLQTSGYEWPLGWRLSPVSQLLLRAQAGNDTRCVSAGAGTTQEMQSANCIMATIAHELLAR